MPRPVLALGLVGALALAAAIWLATSALGEGTRVRSAFLRTHRPGSGVPGPVAELRALLGGMSLTQAQRERVDRIAAEHQQAVRPAQIRAGRKRRELRDLMGSGQTDESEIRAKVSEFSDAVAETALLTSKAVADIISLLTPAQQRRLAELREQRREAAEQWMSSGLPDRETRGAVGRRGHHAQDTVLPPGPATRRPLAPAR